MNNNQNTSSQGSKGQSSSISSMFGQELHDLGDKIERIAEKLKSSGKTAEGEELYQLGDEVEHFFDKIKNASFDSQQGSQSQSQSQSGIGSSSGAGYGANNASGAANDGNVRQQ